MERYRAREDLAEEISTSAAGNAAIQDLDPSLFDDIDFYKHFMSNKKAITTQLDHLLFNQALSQVE